MSKSALTPKEKEIYDYLCEKIRQRGYAPSVRDIKEALQIKSTATVHSYLARLEEKGLITRESGKSRAMRVDSPEAPAKSARIPILGRVTAGVPILAVENYEDYVDFPLVHAGLSHSQLFALRVQGYSMKDAGILDGDLVVVHKTPEANNGDIVVALLGDEATVKTFYREDGHFRLQPQNPDFEPIITKELYILGRVVGVMRFY